MGIFGLILAIIGGILDLIAWLAMDPSPSRVVVAIIGTVILIVGLILMGVDPDFDFSLPDGS